MTRTIPPDYRPTEDEPFMNEAMQEYFRLKLVAWKEEILHDIDAVRLQLQEENVREADIADRASSESGRTIDLRTRDRARKLVAKIDAALRRIEHGTYGYCDETGQEIGVRRLEARPVATLSLEAQERHERLEKTQRDG